MSPPATLAELRQHLRQHLASGRREHFGEVREAWSQAADDYYWEESQHRWRLEFFDQHGVRPGTHRILDLASGCGQFVLLALREGYDCDGVEPDPWRNKFVERKIDLSGYPAQWQRRFHHGSGEALPFADDSFDYVTSFQTLEHVANPRTVMAEMVRVTRVGGGIHVMCPDYRSTFDAHYQLPWLPLFPRPLARAYLRLLRRPTKGLDTIQYTTRPRVLSWIADAEVGRRFMVLDQPRAAFDNALRRRRLPNLPTAYALWSFWQALKALGRQEASVNLFLRIIRK
jgi:ubiquinone/menaquinone biosynthesis C-methylase UbiE